MTSQIWNLCFQASLSAVCSKLKDPKIRLHEMEVELGQPFK